MMNLLNHLEGWLCLCQIPPPLNFLSLIVTIKTSCKTEDANFFPSNFHSISIEARCWFRFHTKDWYFVFLLAILSSCLYSPSSHESSCRNISLSCCFSDRQTAAPCNAGECCHFQTSAASFLTLKTRNLSHRYNARKKTQKQYEQLSCNKKSWISCASSTSNTLFDNNNAWGFCKKSWSSYGDFAR